MLLWIDTKNFKFLPMIELCIAIAVKKGLKTTITLLLYYYFENKMKA